MNDENLKETLVTLTADIVAAHVSNNSVAVNDLPQLISNIHGALSGLTGMAAEEARPEPKVPIRSSINRACHEFRRSSSVAATSIAKACRCCSMQSTGCRFTHLGNRRHR